MPGTLACELANKSTRKQQDRAQEHCKVAGERITPLRFCLACCYVVSHDTCQGENVYTPIAPRPFFFDTHNPLM